jgi:hypothetical protein
MRRYLIERDVHDRLRVSVNETGERASLANTEGASIDQVIWIHSFVTTGKKKMLCVYDGPSVLSNACIPSRNMLPSEDITAINMFDPQFYK